MKYDLPLFRPPSEANSLILQITLGCSHNRCKFCYMYKTKRFRIRRFEDIRAEIEEASEYADYVEKIFLADGDALVVKTETLLKILELIRNHFPNLRRVSAYANPSNILRKSEEELKALSSAKLNLVYIGIESGDDEILRLVDKGATSQEIKESIIKAKACGMQTSTTVILGLGGRERSKEHTQNTARLINEAPPDYLSLLTLMLGPFEEEFRREMNGKWTPLGSIETLVEIREIVKGIDRKGIIFRTNHASNYLPLKGTISEDKVRLINILNRAIEDPENAPLRPEYLRGL